MELVELKELLEKLPYEWEYVQSSVSKRDCYFRVKVPYMIDKHIDKFDVLIYSNGDMKFLLSYDAIQFNKRTPEQIFTILENLKINY